MNRNVNQFIVEMQQNTTMFENELLRNLPNHHRRKQFSDKVMTR